MLHDALVSLHILLHWQRHTVLYIMFCSLLVICTKKCVVILECCPYSEGEKSEKVTEAIEKRNRKKEKNERKEIKREGATLLSLSTLVLMFSTCFIVIICAHD